MKKVLNALGKVRLLCGKILQELNLLTIDPKQFNFLWVVDFPLFGRYTFSSLIIFRSQTGQGGYSESKYECLHHPFTAPHPDDIELIYKVSLFH